MPFNIFCCLPVVKSTLLFKKKKKKKRLYVFWIVQFRFNRHFSSLSKNQKKKTLITDINLYFRYDIEAYWDLRMNMIYFHIFAGPFWWKMHVLNIFAFTVYGELHDLQKPWRLFGGFFSVKSHKKLVQVTENNLGAFSHKHKKRTCVFSVKIQ